MSDYTISFAPFAYESIDVSSTAVGLTSASTYSSYRLLKAFITLESAGTGTGGEIRWRIDGTSPTATEGHLLEPGQTLFLEDPVSIANFKAIRSTTTDAKLRVTYFRG